jgi:hypothetical protein
MICLLCSPGSKGCFLTAAFRPGSNSVFPSFVLALTLPQLLLDLFCDEVDRCVEIRFDVSGE